MNTYLAQSEIISIVMIAAVIVGLISLAYTWGVPIIEKNTAMTDFELAKKFMLDLDRSIRDIANSGGGEVELEIPVGIVRVVQYDSTNSIGSNNITLELISNQPLVMGSESFLKTNNLDEPAIYGSEPRIIRMTGERYGTQYLIKIILHYRSLLSGNNLYNIALDTGVSGREQGSGSIQISFLNTTRTTDVGGRDLTLTYVHLTLT